MRKISKGLVINVSKYSSANAVVTVISTDGKITFNITNVYKPKSNFKECLLVGNIIEFDYDVLNSEFCKILSVKLIYDISKKYTSYNMGLFLMYFSSSLQRYSLYNENRSDEELEVYFTILENLDEENYLVSSLLFTSNLIRYLGLLPDTESCIYCGKTNNLVSFSFSEGGFVCKDCVNRNMHPFYSKTELQVIRFSFFPFSNENLFRKVPYDSLKRVLLDMNTYLQNQFQYSVDRNLLSLLSE